MTARRVDSKARKRSKSSTKSAHSQTSQARRSRSTPRTRNIVPVVGIGASAGGLSALKNYFLHMPPDSGVAFVVIVHRSHDSISLLPTLLAKVTSMPIHEITDKATIQPNHLYLARPGGHIALHDTFLKVTMNHSRSAALQYPIDSCFISLAQKRRSKAVGIILSGTGTDGTLGVKAIRASHGLTIAQEEDSAEFSAMPHHAISMGFIDHILQIKDMPETVLKFLQQDVTPSSDSSPSEPSFPAKSLKTTLSLIQQETGHQYTLSEFSSIPVKIQQRIQANKFTDLEQYNTFLIQHPEEVFQLNRDILTSHSRFFREPSSLKDLENAFLKKLQHHPPRELFRVWVAGCAISEEAYSIAMILHECCQQFSPPFSYKVFATDLNAHAIELARSGRFPSIIEKTVAIDRLEKHFIKRHQQWFIRKSIRDHLVFSVHDVFSDPPFIQLDALCCRNLFMPTEQHAQKQLLLLFHSVLKPKGILCLNNDKLLSSQPNSLLFTPIDKHQKLFHRSGQALERSGHKRSLTHEHQIPSFPTALSKIQRQKHFPLTQRTSSVNYPKEIETVLLKYHVPPCILTTMKGDLIYTHGRVNEYFSHRSGDPYTSLNVLDLIHPELKPPLSKAIQRIRKSGIFFLLNSLMFYVDDAPRTLDIAFRRLSHPPGLRDLLLITFDRLGDSPEDLPSLQSSQSTTPDKHSPLNRELRIMKRSLQTTIEELESANEEMNETYEEIQSANEELFSMNAELENAKQETQALNEELQMMNVELQEKLEEYVRVQDDFTNLITGTQAAALFLDRQMKITHFTPAVNPIFSVLSTDIGRSIIDLNSQLTTKRYLEYGNRVLKTGKIMEFEESTFSHVRYVIRICPYTNSKGEVRGLVMTFQDCTNLRNAEAYTTQMMETVTQPLMITDENFRIMRMNTALLQTFMTRKHADHDVDISRILGVSIKKLQRVKTTLLGKHESDQGKHHIETFHIGTRPDGIGWTCTVCLLDYRPVTPCHILMAFATSKKP